MPQLCIDIYHLVAVPQSIIPLELLFTAFLRKYFLEAKRELTLFFVKMKTRSQKEVRKRSEPVLNHCSLRIRILEEAIRTRMKILNKNQTARCIFSLYQGNRLCVWSQAAGCLSHNEIGFWFALKATSRKAGLISLSVHCDWNGNEPFLASWRLHPSDS